MPNCRTCGAEIEWVKTEGGRNMPLDAVSPSARKVMVVIYRNGERVAVMVPERTSHFATCPEADKHRKESGQS